MKQLNLQRPGLSRRVAGTAGVLAGLLVTAAMPLHAQRLSGLERGDPRLREAEWLADAGLLADAHAGQGPYSGREVERLLAVSRARIDSLLREDPQLLRARARIASLDAFPGPFAGASADSMRGRIHFRALGAGAGLAHLESPSRVVEPFNGLGYVDARVNPLGDRPTGRRLAEGTSALAWTSAMASAGSWLELTGRLGAGLHTGSDTWRPEVERLVLAGRVGNAIIAVGRDHVRWGQGFQASTLFSNDAPPLDMLRVSTDAPVVLPWILGLAGPLRATLLVADLTGPGHFTGERLAAWKVSVLPWHGLELGATVASQQGGRGAPPARFRERVADLIPLVDAIFLGDRDLQASNKLAGVDARLRIPGLSNFTTYLDLLVDDFDLRRVASTFTDDAAWVAGIALPRVGGTGVGIAVEQHHTGVRFYRHGDFRSGVTHRGELLGNPLGPDGDAVHARLLVDRGPMRTFEVRGAIEHRRAHQYVSSGGIAADDGTLRFHIVELRPVERRARATVSASHWIEALGTSLDGEAGLERVLDAGHVAGRRRTGVLVRLGVARYF